MPQPLRAFHIFGDQFVELETLPDALPSSGYLWVAASRSTFETAIGELQTKLLAWTGAQLFDLHISDLLNKQLTSNFDYTSAYDLLVFRRLAAGAIEVASFPVAEGIWIGVLPFIQLVAAIAVIGGLQVLFYSRPLGRAFRATADDPSVAQLMGLDNRHVFALAMAVSLAVIAVAGVLIAIRTNFDPAIGPARLIFGFEAVIIGGLGSLWGTLAGGIILGVSQAIGAHIDPGWQQLAGHLAFLAILAVRPQGLFPRIQG